MSFALARSDGSARLLQPVPPARRGGADGAAPDERSERVLGAIQAINRFSAEVRKEARGLKTARTSRSASAEHVEQIASVARAMVGEARRCLTELSEAGADEGTAEEQKLMRLRYDKMAEDLSRAAADLEQRWSEFRAADADWIRRQAAFAADEAAAAAAGSSGDLERGGGGAPRRLLQTDDVVSQADLDLHTVCADEYAREVREVSQGMSSLSRAMVALAREARCQGEMLSSIEDNMCQAVEKTADAKEQVAMTDAREQRSSRCLCILVAAASLLSVAIVAAVRH